MTRALASGEEARRLREFVRCAELMKGRIAGARVARPEDAEELAQFLSHETIGPRIYTMPDPINACTMRAFIDDHLLQRARGEGILFVSFNSAGQATAYFDVELWRRNGPFASSAAPSGPSARAVALAARAAWPPWNGASISLALIASAKRLLATMNDRSVFFHDWASSTWAK
jgi:hypothetical protein